MILEICAYNIQSCIIAERAGAGRIELCADPLQGGTTPSFGTIEYALNKIAIPIFPMIRSRGGNFVYDADEIAIMKKDIMQCRELGCPGIATGIQLPDGRIDATVLQQIVEWAYPMQVTCHKVFDAVPDPFVALEEVIEAGCSRILTSGLQRTAIEGATLLAQLVARAGGRIIIMPGGGVRSSNIAALAATTLATEYHSSALLSKEQNNIADEHEVRRIVGSLQLAVGS
jgi:copper homeostasis protein